MHRRVISFVTFLWVIRNKIQRDSVWPPLFVTTFSFHRKAFLFSQGFDPLLLHCCLPHTGNAFILICNCRVIFMLDSVCVCVLMLWARAYWFLSFYQKLSCKWRESFSFLFFFYIVWSRFNSPQKSFNNSWKLLDPQNSDLISSYFIQIYFLCNVV